MPNVADGREVEVEPCCTPIRLAALAQGRLTTERAGEILTLRVVEGEEATAGPREYFQHECSTGVPSTRGFFA